MIFTFHNFLKTNVIIYKLKKNGESILIVIYFHPHRYRQVSHTTLRFTFCRIIFLKQSLKIIVHVAVTFTKFMFVTTGTLFGSIAIVENICNLVGSVLGGAIYSATVSYYRGMAYLVLAGFMLIALILLL